MSASLVYERTYSPRDGVISVHEGLFSVKVHEAMDESEGERRGRKTRIL